MDKVEKELLDILMLLGKARMSQIDIDLKVNIVKKLNEAINYTRCCTELKDKKKPTFEEWLKDNFEYLSPTTVVSKDHICVWTKTEIKDIYNSLHL